MSHQIPIRALSSCLATDMDPDPRGRGGNARGRRGKAAALGTKSLVAYFARAGEVQLRKANKRKVGRPQKEAARIRKGSNGPRANCWSDVRLSEFRNGGVHARAQSLHSQWRRRICNLDVMGAT